MTRKKVEYKLSKYRHSLELVRTIVPLLVLFLQAIILGNIL